MLHRRWQGCKGRLSHSSCAPSVNGICAGGGKRQQIIIDTTRGGEEGEGRSDIASDRKEQGGREGACYWLERGRRPRSPLELAFCSCHVHPHVFFLVFSFFIKKEKKISLFATALFQSVFRNWADFLFSFFLLFLFFFSLVGSACIHIYSYRNGSDSSTTAGVP